MIELRNAIKQVQEAPEDVCKDFDGVYEEICGIVRNPRTNSEVAN
jgi:hypothetical protein